MVISGNLQVITGDSPESLVKLINGLGRSVDIVQIVPYGYRHVAYYLEVKETIPQKKPKGAK